MESILQPSLGDSIRLSLRPYIECEESRWNNHPDSPAIVERAVAQVADYLLAEGLIPRSPSVEPSIDIVLGNDDGVRNLNLQWRGIDRPTNVLSFPSLEDDERAQVMAADQFDGHCGDIYLALETIEKEAIEQNKKFAHHLHHLTIHSLLHIFGLDHMETEEAEAMEAIEIELLEKSGIANPYELTQTGSNDDKAGK